MKRYLVVILYLLFFDYPLALQAATPVLNFSDITSGPNTGLNDGLGEGAIVTVWGNNLGSSQGNSLIKIGGKSPAYIYYWKDADGQLPSGPANLYTSHKMQEVSFSVPSSLYNGTYNISVNVDGKMSNTIPFTIRDGKIYFVKPTGDDTNNNGSWNSPWETLNVVLSGDGKIAKGDIVYVCGITTQGDIDIGNVNTLQGDADNPFSVIGYPNTTNYIFDSQTASFRNFNNENYFWNFSKFIVDTNYQAFSIFQGSRIIGNKVTGPTVNSGYSGWIGGGCAGTVPNNCGGHNILGNEIYNYGKDDGSVDEFNHLFYISNRSGQSTAGYEIGWNNIHDNPIYQGIHVYDQSDCGGWNTPILIHNNVIKNQGGNAVNINFNCNNGNNSEIDVYNNIVSTDLDYTGINRSKPLSAIRIDVSQDTIVKIDNNSFYGWGSTNVIIGGNTTFNNNIFVNNRDVAFTSDTPSNYSKNLFFNTIYMQSVPNWSFITADSLFTDSANNDFHLQSTSPCRDAGATILLVTHDFDGLTRPQGSAYDIGAYEYVEVGEQTAFNCGSVPLMQVH